MSRRTLAVATAALATLAPAVPSAAQNPRPRNAVSITVAPTRVVYPNSATVSGKVTGQDHAGKTVNLQEDPFPFDNFRTAASAITNNSGDYSFVVRPALNTRYRVVAKTSPDVTSGTVQVQVVPRVSLRVSDSTVSPRTRVTFSGTVAPAHDGGSVQLQRRTSTGSWQTIKTVALVDDGTERSRYATTLTMKRTGVFRTVFKADADHGTGKSPARRVTVS